MADAEKPSPDQQKAASNRRQVSAVVGAGIAKIKAAEAKNEKQWPLPGMPYNGIRPGMWYEQSPLDETGHLPDDCPVYPLGYEGENYYFVDTMGQVFNTGDGAMGVERIQKLFSGHEDFLYWAWPAKEDKKMGADPTFKSERVRRDLYAACRKRGPWSMTDLVRGRGGWRDSQGKLILHCGEYLWIDNELRPTGEVDGYFYVRKPATMLPWAGEVHPAENPAVEIFKLLRSWNFIRGDTDAMFILGWIGVAILGAAMEWRPSIFVAGDAGTGKSELTGKHGLLRAILGRSMVSTTNASEAGLYQLVGHDSLPIGIDEMEAEENPEANRKLIKMARDAAGGSVRIRGGADHKGVEFAAQSTFIFSAINPPPIPPASLSRLAVIQMLALKSTSTKSPVLKAAETVGPRLLRILADNWDKLQWHLEDYYGVLREAGYDNRGQKTFGTFLACAHVMLGLEGLRELGLPSDTPADWGKRLAPEVMPELEGKKETWRDCLEKILGILISQHVAGKQQTVAQVIDDLFSDRIEHQEAKTRLAAAELGLLGVGTPTFPYMLAIPNNSQMLGKALLDTPYGAKDGNGAWTWALRRAPEPIVYQKIEIRTREDGSAVIDNRVTVAGQQKRCIFLDLPAFRKSLEF